MSGGVVEVAVALQAPPTITLEQQPAPILSALFQTPALLGAVFESQSALNATLLAGQGPAGAPGRDGSDSSTGVYTLDFAYGDATPVLLAAATSGRIEAIRVDVYTAFDGHGCALSVGTLGSPDAYMPAAMIDPTQGDVSFEISTLAPLSADAYLYITPGSGASTGSGHVTLRIQV